MANCGNCGSWRAIPWLLLLQLCLTWEKKVTRVPLRRTYLSCHPFSSGGGDDDDDDVDDDNDADDADGDDDDDDDK